MVNLEERTQHFDVNGVFKAPLHYTHASAIQTRDGYHLDLAGMVGFDESGKLVIANA